MLLTMSECLILSDPDLAAAFWSWWSTTCVALEFLQVLQGILDQPQEGSGAIERQSVRAQALLMLAKVHKVS